MKIRSKSKLHLDKVLMLADMTNASVGPDYMKEVKEKGRGVVDTMDKSAVIGVTGLKGMLLKGYNVFSGDTVKYFKTKEEALDYLVS